MKKSIDINLKALNAAVKLIKEGGNFLDIDMKEIDKNAQFIGVGYGSSCDNHKAKTFEITYFNAFNIEFDIADYSINELRNIVSDCLNEAYKDIEIHKSGIVPFVQSELEYQEVLKAIKLAKLTSEA